MRRTKQKSGFTLVELLMVIGILALLFTLTFGAVRHFYHAASLAVSSNNLRQLTVGAITYLGDHDMQFWKYRENVPGEGIRWWYGFESMASLGAGEGSRTFDPNDGPLGGYIPAGLMPDPSFALTGRAFKPKYRFGYIGIAYNVLLADHEGNRMRGWMGVGTPVRLSALSNPERVVMFATSAQVNTFQSPASPSNPMIEEFYGIDDVEVTVHFRHRGKALVAFASGAVGHLEMHPSTLDSRAPDAMIGRFAPAGDTSYLR